MIDLLLKAIDRMIALFKIRDKRMRARYEEIYKPSFAELQSVHADYLDMFTELETKLLKIDPTLPGNDLLAVEALEFLRARRIKLLAVREKLWAIQALATGKAAQNLPKEEREFLWSLVAYFTIAGVVEYRYYKYSSRSTLFLDHLETMVHKVAAPDSISDISRVRKQCREAISELRVSWGAVVEQYNELRLRYTHRAT